MKKTILLLALTFILFTTHCVMAQFEQKFTLQFAGGYSQIIGDEQMSSLFGGGATIDGGLQFNFNRSVSLVALVKYATYGASSEDLPIGSDLTYMNLGVSLCPKIKFAPSSVVHPYVFAGLNYNYIKYQFNAETNKAPAAFGLIFGGGVEFDLSEKVALFVQPGYNAIVAKFGDNSDANKIYSFFIQTGININLLKSKSL